VYDPAPRPLRWETVNGRPYPLEEDQVLFGIGGKEALILEWHPLVAHYRSLPNNPGSPRPFLPSSRGRTEQDRLDAYARLVDLKAPNDPERGGLAADEILPDGTIKLNYWDLSDDHVPHRKQVWYWPKQNDVGMHVYQWNPTTDAWEDEGFDFERDFSSSLPAIMQAFSIVTTAIVGALTGNPELASAWSAAMGVGVKAAASRVPPDTGEVLAAFGGFAQAAIGKQKIDIGQIFGSPSMKNDFLQSFSGMLEKFRVFAAEKDAVLTFADQIRAGLAKGFDHFPSVDLAGALSLGAKSIVPDVFAKELAAANGIDPTSLVGSVSREIQTAAHTFGLDLKVDVMARGVGDNVYYSLRKLSVDKPLFDATYATLLAQAARDKDYIERVATVSSETFRPALDPFHGQDPRANLDAMVRTLQKRYHLR
jgi:hypothetical protein